VLERPLSYRTGGEVGPAFGAARLARLAVTGEAAGQVCTVPTLERIVDPDPVLRDGLATGLTVYRRLYGVLRETFAATP